MRKLINSLLSLFLVASTTLTDVVAENFDVVSQEAAVEIQEPVLIPAEIEETPAPATPTPDASQAPTMEPSPLPSPSPDPEAAIEPTAAPSTEPTAEPSAETEPTAKPTTEPTADPATTAMPENTPEATVQPESTPEATSEPTPEPTSEPTPEPTAEPEPELQPEPEATEIPENTETIDNINAALAMSIKTNFDLSEYVSVSVVPDSFAYAEMVIEPVEVSGRLTVLEAYSFKEDGGNSFAIAKLKKVPEIRKGEKLAFYGLDKDGNLFYFPVMDDLKEGSNVVLPLYWYKGFALVKYGTPEPITEISPDIPDDKVSSLIIAGDNLDGISVELTPSAPIDYRTLFSYDIDLFKEGEKYEPDTPLFVTVTASGISELTAKGFGIGVSHVLDDGKVEEITPNAIDGDQVTFEARSFSVYDVYKIGSDYPVTVESSETVYNFDDEIEVWAAGGMENIQWQVLIPGTETWINIQGQNDTSIKVTYPMVAYLMNENTVQVRAVGTMNGEDFTDDVQNIEFVKKGTTRKTRKTAKKLQAGEGLRGDFNLVDDGNADTYNIVVNFVFTDGSIAQEPIVATVDAGTDFSQSVSIPQLIGYDSYLESESEPRYMFDINLTNIQSNKIYTVTYRPAIVEYRVEHYWQDVYSNSYFLHDVETMEGYTGDIVEKADKNYPGMYALLYEQPTIAADGSTVLPIYYDRFYYLIDYDLDGGTGGDPIYARYETPLDTPTPVKLGYTFSGWEPAVPDTIPVGGGRYKALWTPEETTYTVIYWYENTGPEELYAVAASDEKTAKSGSTVYNRDFRNQAFEGRDDTFFTYNEDKNEYFTIDGNGSTVVNVYFRRNPVNMTFIYNNGTSFTMSGKYESSFDSYGYKWPDETFWRYENTSGGYTSMTFMDAFIPTSTMPDKLNIEFTETSRSGHTLAFYRQNLNKTYDTDDLAKADVRVVSNGTFTITEKYEGFHVRDYRRSSSGSRQAWVFSDGSEYSEEDYYAPSTNNNETQYGVVNGNIVALQSGVWLKPDGTEYTGEYKFQPTTSTSGTMYGVRDGNLVTVRYGYYYTSASGAQPEYDGDYTYTPTTSTSGTLYGVVNGNVQRVYYRRGSYRTSNSNYATVYNGTVYTRGYASTVNTSEKYGFISGQMQRLYAGFVGDGYRYQGERYTASPAYPVEDGTYYGFDNGEMLLLSGESDSYYYHGQPYHGDRYTTTKSPSSYGTYYGMNPAGEMERMEYVTLNDGWSNWVDATAGSTTISNDNYTYQIRFARNKYDLNFYNYNYVMTDKKELVDYEKNLSGYEFTPSYPDALPYNKYQFVGWYNNEELQGEPFNFNTTMPAHNMTLFAKWVPKTFHASVYRNIKDMENDTNVYVEGDYPYGTLIPTPLAPESPKYSFVGWFYQNSEGDEIPFQFSSSTVTRDIKIYGKWTSEVLVTYTIRYEDEEGHTIADPFTSSAIEGSSRTFKATDELYDEYSVGYFPLVASHSIMFDSEKNNDYTFVYRYLDALPYTVRYINDRTEEPLLPDKIVEDNKKIAVTEKFAPIPGYIPDRFQKNLILQLEEPTKNVITFRYTKDTRHAFYLKSHYIEKENGEWRLYNSLDVLEDLGTDVSIDPMDIEGYTYDPDNELNVKNGIVTADGLELKLYYKMNEYPYKVRYLDQKTNVALAPEKIGSGKYSAKITESAIEIDRYELLGDETQTITITKDETDPIRNIITFYYQLAQAEYRYIPVGGGAVSCESEVLAALTGLINGSEPEYDPAKLQFVGWFMDEEGTVPVDPALVENEKITPVKQEVNGKMRYVSATYYALFRPAAVSVRIVKIGSDTKAGIANSVFTLRQNNSLPDVVIDGNIVPVDANLVSDSSGIVFDGDLIISDDDYILKEVTPTFGYYKYDGNIAINVSADAVTVVAQEGVDLTQDGDTWVITVTNKKILVAPTGYENSRRSFIGILAASLFVLILALCKSKKAV